MTPETDLEAMERAFQEWYASVIPESLVISVSGALLLRIHKIMWRTFLYGAGLERTFCADLAERMAKHTRPNSPSRKIAGAIRDRSKTVPLKAGEYIPN